MHERIRVRKRELFILFNTFITALAFGIQLLISFFFDFFFVCAVLGSVLQKMELRTQ
jgi:hypothetical protein